MSVNAAFKPLHSNTSAD